MTQHDIRRLSAYLDGELESEERREIEAALARSVELREELRRLQDVKEWATNFPGRAPSEHVWQSVVQTVKSQKEPTFAAPNRRLGTAWSFGRLASFIPSIPASWSTRSQRLLVMALAGIALAGMGRSYALEKRAAAMESKVLIRGQAIGQLLADVGWKQTAQAYRGAPGRYFTVECAPGGDPGPVWGTDHYTDDSSICTAAVHAGLLTFERGGSAGVHILPGEDHYRGSEHNGVVSRDYDRSWPGTFEFVTAEETPSQIPNSVLIEWKKSAEGLRGMIGHEFSFTCPAGGKLGSVWGTGYYTDDSSICTAAVHAGLVTPENGGTVVMRIEPGRKRFGGSAEYGVESSSYGAWPGSFVFLSGERGTLLSDPDFDMIGWRTDAADLRIAAGQIQTLRCTPNGNAHTVWGSGVYTDDSSICSAAVHDGRITLEEGGVVSVEGLPGREAYGGELLHGIQSMPYGRWRASFRFVN